MKWNDLKATWPNVRDNLGWRVHNDKLTNFWTDDRFPLVTEKSQDGEFSSKVAYNLFSNVSSTPNELTFKMIWKLRVQEIVWFHVWKVDFDIFVKNKQGLKRHIAQSTRCLVCVEQPKSIIQLIQDYIKIMNV
ncbi:hypothetical protein CR513_09534, partial [Mucuna pruriens]